MKKSGLFAVILAVSMGIMLGCGKKGDEKKTAAAFPDSIVDNELIVTVNDHPVLGKDLRLFAALFQRTSRSDVPDSTFNQALLEKVIDRVLMWREAVANGITIDDSTSNAVIGRFIGSMGGEGVVNNFLRQMNFEHDELMSNLKKDLVINRFLKKRFSKEVNIAKKDARDYYEKNRNQFIMPDSVRARHILIRVMPDDSEEIKAGKREKIEDILAKVRSGEDFSELARLYSDGPSSIRGGDLGQFAQRAMVQPFDSVAFSLDVGEVSGVVETGYGYHIVKVEDRKEGVSLEFDDVKGDLMDRLWEFEIAVLLQNHLQKIRQVAIIKKNY